MLSFFIRSTGCNTDHLESTVLPRVINVELFREKSNRFVWKNLLVFVNSIIRYQVGFHRNRFQIRFDNQHYHNVIAQGSSTVRIDARVPTRSVLPAESVEKRVYMEFALDDLRHGGFEEIENKKIHSGCHSSVQIPKLFILKPFFCLRRELLNGSLCESFW